ncbi:MAG: hypothetical protein ACWA5T_09425 [Parvularcula sp.]
MLILLALAAGPTEMPLPLAEAMVPATDTEAVSYHVEMDDEDVTWKAIITPGAPQGERISVLSPPRPEWPKGAGKALDQYDAAADGDIWCDSMDEMVGREIEELSVTPVSASYRFKPLIPEDADKADRKFAEAARGEIHLARADDTARWQVKEMKMWLEKPFKPAIVAKLNSFDLHIACAPDRNGRMYQASTTTNVAGSAMGRRFDETESVRISLVETTK